MFNSTLVLVQGTNITVQKHRSFIEAHVPLREGWLMPEYVALFIEFNIFRAKATNKR